MIEFSLPMPPSGNHRNIWGKHGPYRSPAYRDYIKRGMLLLGRVPAPQFDKEAKLGCKVEVFPKDARRRDLDNSVKCVWDLIQAKWGIDDYRYWHLEIDRGMILKPDGLMKITIWALQDEKDCATISE